MKKTRLFKEKPFIGKKIASIDNELLYYFVQYKRKLTTMK